MRIGICSWRRSSPAILLTADPGYLNLLAARQAEATLMRGFTTIRDMGGPVFGLKRAIDEGITVGPRIYPSGAMISQTSGHGDFRARYEVPRALGGPLSQSEIAGIAAIADSPDEVRLRAREQLRQGASQIKLMAGGGVSSPHNPIEFDPVHRSGASCRGRGGRKLGHLRGRTRLYARCDPAGGRRRRQVHRTRPTDRRAHRPIAGGQGYLVELAAADLRCRRLRTDEPGVAEEGAGSVRREPRTPTSSQRSTRSRRPGAPTFWAMRELPAGRGNISP